MRSIDQFVVHCSATPPDMDIGADWIRHIHMSVNSWRDIGYHYVIRRDGRLELGRPEEEVGAHVQGHNAFSLGICLVGGVDDTNRAQNNFTAAQFFELENLLTELRSRFPHTEILGHRDFSPDQNNDGIIESSEWIKECPCFNVMTWCQSVGLDPQTQVRE